MNKQTTIIVSPFSCIPISGYAHSFTKLKKNMQKQMRHALIQVFPENVRFVFAKKELTGGGAVSLARKKNALLVVGGECYVDAQAVYIRPRIAFPAPLEDATRHTLFALAKKTGRVQIPYEGTIEFVHTSLETLLKAAYLAGRIINEPKSKQLSKEFTQLCGK